MTFLDFMEALLGGRARRLVKRHRLAPYIPGTLVYYPLDASTHFRFRFAREASGEIRVYILEQPAYGARDRSLRMTHRLGDHHPHFICFEPPPRSTDEARRVARAWSELTLRYIRTGKTF
jgi:hypothetical protein